MLIHISHLTVSFESLRAKAVSLLQGTFELLCRKLREDGKEGLSTQFLSSIYMAELAGGFVTEGERSPSFPSPYFTTQLYKSEHTFSGRRQAREKLFTFKREDLTWKLDNNSIESRSTSGSSRLIDLLNSEKNQNKII